MITVQDPFPQRVNLYVDWWHTEIKGEDIQSEFWRAGKQRMSLLDHPIAIGRYQNDDVNWPQGKSVPSSYIRR